VVEPPHRRTASDELVYVLSGEVTLVTDSGEEVLHAGDAAGFPANDSNGHCLQNRSAIDAQIPEIGTRTAGDTAHYSDIDMTAPPTANPRSTRTATAPLRKPHPPRPRTLPERRRYSWLGFWPSSEGAVACGWLDSIHNRCSILADKIDRLCPIADIDCPSNSDIGFGSRCLLPIGWARYSRTLSPMASLEPQIVI
jgi:Cupin domain